MRRQSPQNMHYKRALSLALLLVGTLKYGCTLTLNKGQMILRGKSLFVMTTEVLATSLAIHA
jgi:hypothetical protein